MQYDENGYPMKSGSNVSSNYGATPNATAAASSSAAYSSPQQHQQQNPQQQQHQEGPRYDEHGYPVKPQPSVPQQQPNQREYQQDSGPRYDERGYPVKQQQQQQQQQANALPAYAQQGGAYVSTNNNLSNPNNQESGSPYHLQPYGKQLPQHNYWSTGLCDMFADCDVCMEGCCCPFCQEGRIYEAAANDTPNTMNVLACCTCWLTMACLFPVVDLYNRRKVVEKYNIQDESCCTSFCFSCCCPCISVCQMQRELQARGMYPGGQCCAPSRDPSSPIGQRAPMGTRNSYQQSI